MGDNHHPTGGGSFCPSTRCLNDPPWDVRLVFFDGFLGFNRIEIRNPSIIESYGYRGLKKKDLAVKKGMNTVGGEPFFFPQKYGLLIISWGVEDVEVSIKG